VGPGSDYEFNLAHSKEQARLRAWRGLAAPNRIQ
jgi:hypothetical protein